MLLGGGYVHWVAGPAILPRVIGLSPANARAPQVFKIFTNQRVKCILFGWQHQAFSSKKLKKSLSGFIVASPCGGLNSQTM